MTVEPQVSPAPKPTADTRSPRFSVPARASSSMTSGIEADPDHDEIKNLAEYAFHLPPKSAGVLGLPVAGRDLSGALTLTYTLLKSATDITCVAEVSSDLTTWHSGPGYTSVQSTDQGLTWSVVATSLFSPGIEPRQFMRVRITRP